MSEELRDTGVLIGGLHDRHCVGVLEGAAYLEFPILRKKMVISSASIARPIEKERYVAEYIKGEHITFKFWRHEEMGRDTAITRLFNCYAGAREFD